MLAIPLLSQVSSMAEIVSKEAQKKSKAGICFRSTSHNKHTLFLSLQRSTSCKSKTSAINRAFWDHKPLFGSKDLQKAPQNLPNYPTKLKILKNLLKKSQRRKGKDSNDERRLQGRSSKHQRNQRASELAGSRGSSKIASYNGCETLRQIALDALWLEDEKRDGRGKERGEGWGGGRGGRRGIGVGGRRNRDERSGVGEGGKVGEGGGGGGGEKREAGERGGEEGRREEEGRKWGRGGEGDGEWRERRAPGEREKMGCRVEGKVGRKGGRRGESGEEGEKERGREGGGKEDGREGRGSRREKGEQRKSEEGGRGQSAKGKEWNEQNKEGEKQQGECKRGGRRIGSGGEREGEEEGGVGRMENGSGVTEGERGGRGEEWG
ncbi:hypothetical protein Tco_1080037 [Tanacetum coccineum]|uniref:Uncharacterized protein n=1 Tax=Tanacetum coccineum TaxID=301880 RepID=A0ABQ5HVB4_9ASTR